MEKPHDEVIGNIENSKSFIQSVRNGINQTLRLVANILKNPLRSIRELREDILIEIRYRKNCTKFKEDIEELKNELDTNSEVVYIGSYDDTSVQDVFPKASHVDLRRPKKMPVNFNFFKAEAKHLPFGNESIDLAAFKHLGVLSDPAVALELARILKPGGKILDFDCTANIDLEMESTNIEELVDQNRALDKLSTLHANGLQIKKSLKNGSVLIEKNSVIDETLKKKVLERRAKNKNIAFKLMESEIDHLDYWRIFEALDLNIAQFRSIEWEECEKQLDYLKDKLSLRVYNVVLNKLREYIERCTSSN